MAGTVVITQGEGVSSPNKRIVFDWTSDAAGAVNGTLSRRLNGYIRAVKTNPDNTAAPTDLYDITLTDEDGFDVLAGAGANRSTVNTEQIQPTINSQPVAVDSPLELKITNAGNAKKGRLILILSSK
jgi:hypothetical protein